MAPYVSLAIYVFNGEQFISEAIRSILVQDFRDFELIITDNASTDGTEKICREFAASDDRVKYVRNERNLGAGPNQNKGFELSSGKYFKWCACDDYISPDYLSRCVSVLDANPDAVLAQGTPQFVDRDGNPIPLVGALLPDMEGLGPERRFQKVIAEQRIWYQIFGLFRRDALAKSTLHRRYYGSDHSLIGEMALLGRFEHVSDAVFYCRDHANQSMKLSLSDQTFWQCTDAKAKDDLQHINRAAHLLEIAIRHRRIISPFATIPIVLRSELRPRRIVQHLLDLISLVSPVSRPRLRKIGWWVADKAANLIQIGQPIHAPVPQGSDIHLFGSDKGHERSEPSTFSG